MYNIIYNIVYINTNGNILKCKTKVIIFALPTLQDCCQI